MIIRKDKCACHRNNHGVLARSDFYRVFLNSIHNQRADERVELIIYRYFSTRDCLGIFSSVKKLIMQECVKDIRISEIPNIFNIFTKNSCRVVEKNPTACTWKSAKENINICKTVIACKVLDFTISLRGLFAVN